jgi:putative endonuclease
MKPADVAGWGEAEAARYLRRQGWELLETNWHCRYGELDLVARDAGAIVFVEVKARRSRAFGPPEEALTPAKRRRLLRSAWTYLDEHGLAGQPWRVDVIAIEGRPGAPPRRLDHYADALPDEADLTP